MGYILCVVLWIQTHDLCNGLLVELQQGTMLTAKGLHQIIMNMKKKAAHKDVDKIWQEIGTRRASDLFYFHMIMLEILNTYYI